MLIIVQQSVLRVRMARTFDTSSDLHREILRGRVFLLGLVDPARFRRRGLVGRGCLGCCFFSWRSRSRTWFRRLWLSLLVDLWDSLG